MNTIEILKHTDLFYNLTQDQLELIAAIIVPRNAALGEVIFEEGSKNREIFVIAQGSVEVSHKNYNNLSYADTSTDEASGEESAEEAVNATIVLAILSAGQSFGEIAFIDKATRGATCRSLSDDTVLLAINPEQLMAQCEAYPAMGFAIILNIAKDLAFIIRELDLHMLGENRLEPAFNLNILKTQ